MRVSRVDEMREMDKLAGSEYGLPEEILMENAGSAAFDLIVREIGIPGKRFAVVCGIGNNGGDGLVVARRLGSRGADVSVLIAGDPSKYKGGALANYDRAVRMRIPISLLSSTAESLPPLKDFEVVIDGLFGIGLSRNVEGMFAQLIERMNACKATIVSLDIPSGIHGDTGTVLGTAVRANYTVTFGLPKQGNLLYPGYSHCGKLFVSHISFPPALCDSDSIRLSTNDPLVLPSRDPAGHKGSFGDALFIAGAPGYFGAPGFAALAHLSAGGGYARLAAPMSIVPYIASRAPEVVYHPLCETDAGTLSIRSVDEILDIASMCDIVVIGPGLSLAEETQETVRLLVKQIEKPLLIDGDALSAVSTDTSVIKNRKHPTVLTPHPGEMARLLGMNTGDVERSRIEVLRKCAADLNAIVVLKGAHSLVGFPDGHAYINLSGNSGMATAGSGDTLTGTITAMHGLGLGIGEAVRTAVFAHGLAGDIAAEKIGEDGMKAPDLLASLPSAVRRLREDYESLACDSYGKVKVL